MKSNVARLLESAGIPFTLRSYDPSDGRIDAPAVAAKLGVPADRLFKTLVARTQGGEVVVYCLPGSCELDLKKAASAAGAKSVELVRAAELKELTGYVRGGCSPIGMKRAYRVWLEESAAAFDTIVVSAGLIGLQLEVGPGELCRVTGAQTADLI